MDYKLILELERRLDHKKFTECELSLDKIIHEEAKHCASKRTRSGSNT